MFSPLLNEHRPEPELQSRRNSKDDNCIEFGFHVDNSTPQEQSEVTPPINKHIVGDVNYTTPQIRSRHRVMDPVIEEEIV